MFLTIDNDMRNWFFEVFKNTEFANNITLHNKFRVIILDENEMIGNVCLSRGNSRSILMIEAIALSQKTKMKRILMEDIKVNRVLKRVNQSLWKKKKLGKSTKRKEIKSL